MLGHGPLGPGAIHLVVCVAYKTWAGPVGCLLQTWWDWWAGPGMNVTAIKGGFMPPGSSNFKAM